MTTEPEHPTPTPCAYCGKPSEGNHAIHRDGFGVGPQVDLCDACGGDETPTCEQIWDVIAKASHEPGAHVKAVATVTDINSRRQP